MSIGQEANVALPDGVAFRQSRGLGHGSFLLMVHVGQSERVIDGFHADLLAADYHPLSMWRSGQYELLSCVDMYNVV